MKQVIVKIGKGGRTKILAEGPLGAGTEKFTAELARDLGTIQERHAGWFHSHVEEHTHVEGHVHD